MLPEMNKPADALKAYEADLARHPNRFNGLYGAGYSAQKTRNFKKAKMYYRQLLAITDKSASNRPELLKAAFFLKSAHG
jgi:tetratricopeptide (TPR) repeat protein